MKLFRNIRQKVIINGDLRKYLLYAIGEVLLVMVGILLAFQVNKWNDNFTRKTAEIAFYKNIKNQITADKNKIQSELDYNNDYLIEFKYANEIIEANDRTKLDTLGKIVRNLTQYSDFDSQGTIYETVVNSGDIKLIRNIDITNGIRELEEKYTYINRMENIHYDAIIRYVVSSTKSSLKFSNSTIQKPEEIYTYEFQNLLLALMQVMEEKKETYIDGIDQINDVLKSIDLEINATL